MSAYTIRDVRHALALELAISETLGEMSHGTDQPYSVDPRRIAQEASRARIAALQTLLKRAPDDEVYDTEVY